MRLCFRWCIAKRLTWFLVAQLLGGIAATLLFRWLVPNLQSELRKFCSLMILGEMTRAYFTTS